MLYQIISQICKEAQDVNQENYKGLLKRLFKYIHLNENHEIETVALNIEDAKFRIPKHELVRVI